jgi:predicted ATPase
MDMNGNDVVRVFQERAVADLRRELDEVKWWRNTVARKLVKPEHAEGYIQISKRIIKTKRHVLGIPEYPC